MKRVWNIVLILTAGILTSCGGDGDTEEMKGDGHKISGQVTGADGQEVSIWVFEDDGEYKVDSAIIEDGSFTIWTHTKEFREYVVEFGEPSPPALDRNAISNLVYLFPDENTGDIEIKGDFPDIGNNYTISGDKNSEDYLTYLNFVKPINDQMKFIWMQYDSATPDSSDMSLLDSMHFLKKDYAIEYINASPGSPVSWIMLGEFYPPGGMEKFDSTDLSYFDMVKDEMTERYPYSEYIPYIDKNKESILAQLDAIRNGNTADLAPDLNYASPDGNEIALSSLRGQVVLLDFWASWCGPCRMENPNVVKTYNEYKDKGFTVYSVSLDTDKGKWEQAIENDNLTWPNHVSDLKGWQSEAAAIYGVNSIPATFLIDKDGKIIDRNLRGPALEQRLQEILG